MRNRHEVELNRQGILFLAFRDKTFYMGGVEWQSARVSLDRDYR